MANKYYKVVTGTYNEIIITEKELPKAMWSFQQGQGATFEDGACSEIRDIIPEKAMSMGWNRGYKPKAEDQEDIRKELGRSLEDYMFSVKQLCYQAKSLPELEQKTTQLLLN